MFLAMIESHLNSNSVPGVIRLHVQNLFHPFPIIDVLLFLSWSYTKYNLHVVIELASPHCNTPFSQNNVILYKTSEFNIQRSITSTFQNSV